MVGVKKQPSAVKIHAPTAMYILLTWTLLAVAYLAFADIYDTYTERGRVEAALLEKLYLGALVTAYVVIDTLRALFRLFRRQE